MVPYISTASFDAYAPDGSIMYTVIFKETDMSFKDPMGNWEDHTVITADVINWSPRGGYNTPEPSIYIKNIEYDLLKVIYNAFIRGRRERRSFWTKLRLVKKSNEVMTTTLL